MVELTCIVTSLAVSVLHCSAHGHLRVSGILSSAVSGAPVRSPCPSSKSREATRSKSMTLQSSRGPTMNVRVASRPAATSSGWPTSNRRPSARENREWRKLLPSDGLRSCSKRHLHYVLLRPRRAAEMRRSASGSRYSSPQFAHSSMTTPSTVSRSSFIVLMHRFTRREQLGSVESISAICRVPF